EGIGIDDEIKDRIFEPFYTTKADGSGVGLTLAKNIMELHAGDIYFESKKGSGTTFYVILPIDS
ncbi:MAG: ATP-binding protein, partial [Candidatus Goldbacteria bacterium]|nr:ATP-binding protein [Candidatus Goldiibacteriota bacterium]